MEPHEQQTAAQKAKLALQAAGAFARNPKALVALIRYQIQARRQGGQ